VHQGSSGFQVGQRIEHRCSAIEIGGEPGTPVAVERRVESEVEFTG
jgi:hypothetical protein